MILAISVQLMQGLLSVISNKLQLGSVSRILAQEDVSSKRWHGNLGTSPILAWRVRAQPYWFTEMESRETCVRVRQRYSWSRGLPQVSSSSPKSTIVTSSLREWTLYWFLHHNQVHHRLPKWGLLSAWDLPRSIFQCKEIHCKLRRNNHRPTFIPKHRRCGIKENPKLESAFPW